MMNQVRRKCLVQQSISRPWPPMYFSLMKPHITNTLSICLEVLIYRYTIKKQVWALYHSWHVETIKSTYVSCSNIVLCSLHNLDSNWHCTPNQTLCLTSEYHSYSCSFFQLLFQPDDKKYIKFVSPFCYRLLWRLNSNIWFICNCL